MSSAPAKPAAKPINPVFNFLIGGLGGCIATTVIQPLDFVKVQLQVRAEGRAGAKLSAITVGKEIIKERGFMYLYTGLSAAWVRQITYASVRFGLYNTLQDMSKKRKAPGEAMPFYERVGYSLFAGAVGAYVGVPPDMALIRMQSDNNLPVEQRRGYKNVFDALIRTFKEEGVVRMWTGASPTVLRAMAMNVGMLAPYDAAKDFIIKKWGPGDYVRFPASLWAAFWAATCSLPFDNIKVKLQKMAPLPDGTMPYKGVMDCLRQTIAKEGFLGLYVGYVTFVFRVGPHAVTSLLVIDALYGLAGVKK